VGAGHFETLHVDLDTSFSIWRALGLSWMEDARYADQAEAMRPTRA